MNQAINELLKSISIRITYRDCIGSGVLLSLDNKQIVILKENDIALVHIKTEVRVEEIQFGSPTIDSEAVIRIRCLTPLNFYKRSNLH